MVGAGDDDGAPAEEAELFAEREVEVEREGSRSFGGPALGEDRLVVRGAEVLAPHRSRGVRRVPRPLHVVAPEQVERDVPDRHAGAATAAPAAGLREEGLDALQARARKHSMPEVHDVGLPPRLLEHRPRAPGDRGRLPEQEARIEVALQRFGGHPAAGLGQGQAPVDREDVGAGLGHRLDQVPAAVDVQDDRGSGAPDAGDGTGGGRQRPLPVIFARELARPRVEDLHRVRARGELEGQDVRHDVGQEVEEAAERRGLAAHHRLDRREALRAAAFDQIGSQGPRGAAEAEDGRPARDLPANPREDLAGEGDLRVRDRSARAWRPPPRRARARGDSVRSRRTRPGRPSRRPGPGCPRRR